MMRREIGQTASQKKPEQQTFADHLRELRGRFFVIVLVLLAATTLGYTFHDQIIQVLLLPLHGQKLMYITPGGGFDFIFKTSLYAGCLVAVPVLIFQLYRYLAPLLGRRSRRMTFAVIIFSILLAASGMLFGFYIALPAALNFLTNVGSEYVQASLTASSYLNFIVAYMLGLALLFQLPLVLLIINAANGPLSPKTLLKTQQYIIPGTFILAAIITPTPDVANQIMLALPVIGMYQAGVGLVLLQNRKKQPTKQQVSPGTFKPQKVESKTAPKPFKSPQPTAALVVPKPKLVVKQNTKTLPRRHMDVLTPNRPVKLRVPQRSMSQITKTATQSPSLSVDGFLLPSNPNHETLPPGVAVGGAAPKNILPEVKYF